MPSWPTPAANLKLEYMPRLETAPLGRRRCGLQAPDSRTPGKTLDHSCHTLFFFSSCPATRTSGSKKHPLSIYGLMLGNCIAMHIAEAFVAVEFRFMRRRSVTEVGTWITGDLMETIWYCEAVVGCWLFFGLSRWRRDDFWVLGLWCFRRYWGFWSYSLLP